MSVRDERYVPGFRLSGVNCEGCRIWCVRNVFEGGMRWKDVLFSVEVGFGRGLRVCRGYGFRQSWCLASFRFLKYN